jgi:hypothetical protein
MRNILQSKLGVGCLVLIAIVCVAVNFFNLLQRRSPLAAARELPVIDEEAREETYEVPPHSSVAVALRQGREIFPTDGLQRDPFAAVFVAPPAAVTNLPSVPSFQLQAVSIADGRVLAVINRRVVAEGETIEGCRVETILPHEVRLVSPVFGPLTATFDRTPRQSKAAPPNKSPSGNPPAADLPASPAAASPGGSGGTAR